MFLLCSIILFNSFHISQSELLTKNSENYGPFDAKWSHYGSCRGPKSKNLTVFETAMIVENNTYKGVMNFSFTAATRMSEVRMMVYSLNGEQKSLLWNYRVDKPCEHFAIAEILEKQFRVSDCVFPKGQHYWVINFTECTYKYFGSTFFYGHFFFKLFVLSKKGNIACLSFAPMFTKKT